VRASTVLSLLGLLAVATGAAPAKERSAERLIEEIILAGAGRMSLDEAIAMVEKRFNARVVRADVKDHKGRTVYKLRLLAEGSGRVWTVEVDAESGALL
jgi:uncharacterized membrane protein YkoI